jgi:tetratricopeptide (TPR) repeat protein
VWGGAPRKNELRYEPDTGRYEATIDLDRVADVLGGRVVTNVFGRALTIDRRYEADRRHGDMLVGDCELRDGDGLRLLDPSLRAHDGIGTRRLFVDLETTGLSGGAGTVAFLVGCGWFDLGAFQVRQFLLTSYASERALLGALAECLYDCALLVTYNGKTFDVPVMETRWLFHRMEMPLEGVRHFDMLHPARRLWRPSARPAPPASHLEDDAGCRLSTLERTLCGVHRVGDVPGIEIPGRYFQFVRTGNAAPLEAVLEHNRIDLISLAAVTAYGVRLAEQGRSACRDAAETLALGKVYERAGAIDRAVDCYEQAAASYDAHIDTTAEALYRLGRRHRRDRRFVEAAAAWQRILELRNPRLGRRGTLLGPLQKSATEALAIHHEHRARDYETARTLALLLGDDEDVRHRVARLDRKLARKTNSHLLGGC